MRWLVKGVAVKILEWKELDESDKELLGRAKEVRNRAQAPYSNSWVGAAVLCGNSKIYVGCNVERATFSQTTHAEQNAIDTMVADNLPSKSKIMAIAAVGGPAGSLKKPKKYKPLDYLDDVLMPCGHCLQIIWENCFEDLNVKILVWMPNGEIAVSTIGDALPMRFGPKYLGNNPT